MDVSKYCITANNCRQSWGYFSKAIVLWIRCRLFGVDRPKH